MRAIRFWCRAARPEWVEPSEFDALCESLRDQLGPFGYQWLCACAVYPGLRWPLTAYLGAALAKAAGRALPDEYEHLAFCRLPWFRKGWMPDELRLRLIADLTPEHRRIVREAIEHLFHAALNQPESGQSEAAALDFAWPPPRNWRAVLKAYFDTAPGGAPEQDRIFVRYMMGRTPREVDLRMDRALARVLGVRLAGWLNKTVALGALSAITVAVGVWWSVDDLVGPAFTETTTRNSFYIDRAQTSVSGLSSGAYMAGQFHVSFSEALVGAAIVAGGPYDCAEGQLALALNRCMQTMLGAPESARLLDRARRYAAAGRIDPLTGLAGDRVYVFSGTVDATVTPPVVERVVDFYRLAGLPESNIKFVNDLPAGHGFITEDHGGACSATGSPFINDCDYDQAGDLLRHIYGELAPPSA